MRIEEIMAKVALGLGSNTADKLHMLKRARILINILAGTVISASQLFSTEPWGHKDQGEFINQVLIISSDLSPKELHTTFQNIEILLDKKKRGPKYGPRNIDIDLLLYDQVIVDDENLYIPHPRMHERNFVLIPLTTIAPDMIHPTLNMSIDKLAAQCSDESKVVPYLT